MKKLALGLLLGASCASLSAVTPLWMRDAVISPDGSEIAFCYKGDIYKVKASGGEAVRLTTQRQYGCIHHVFRRRRSPEADL